MAESDIEAEHKQGFMDRVKEARMARALKQWELADALGIPQDRYKQYETRSYLPPHLYARFCLICRVDPEWLVTGNGKMAPKERPEPTGEPAPGPARKARRKSAA
ncbi:MAG: helix-turn-helix transcriptional regulator [Arenimonas sp.]